MKIDVLTLFPESIEGFINESIIKRAIASGKVEINLINFRDYSPLNNNQVDDTPYGGGAGMVLRCESGVLISSKQLNIGSHLSTIPAPPP